MLPRGFTFKTYNDGPALWVDGRIVADIVPLGEGRYRACLNPLSFSIRYAYLGSLEEAMDYVSARLTGRITASQHTSFMVQLCDNRTLGATR